MLWEMGETWWGEATKWEWEWEAIGDATRATTGYDKTTITISNTDDRKT